MRVAVVLKGRDPFAGELPARAAVVETLLFPATRADLALLRPDEFIRAAAAPAAEPVRRGVFLPRRLPGLAALFPRPHTAKSPLCK